MLINTTDTVIAVDQHRLVHPIFDKPEEKLDPSKLGPIKLTRGARASLVLLRLYLIAMLLLTVFRCLQLAAIIK